MRQINSTIRTRRPNILVCQSDGGTLKWSAIGGGGLQPCSASFLASTVAGDLCRTVEGLVVVYAGVVSGEHVVTTKTDTSNGFPWGCAGTVTVATSDINGAANTAAINNASCPSYPNKAAALCSALGQGWFLPARDQLRLLNQNISSIGGFSESMGIYWSSTQDYNEYAQGYARVFHFYVGSPGWDTYETKTGSYRVRCVRTY